MHEVINDGGKLWVLGCKTEEEGTAYETKTEALREVLGAVFAIGLRKQHPAIINDNSNVSVYAITFEMTRTQPWPILVQEIQGEETRELRYENMEIGSIANRVIPLYVGRKDDHV